MVHSPLMWSVIGVGALALTLGTNVFRPTLHGLQLSAEIVQRSHQYQEQIRNNKALEQENSYLRSEPGKRWAVRRYTGMVKPGQTVGQVVEEAAAISRPRTGVERFWDWEMRLEAYGTKRWREMVQVLACYVGLRPPDQSANGRNHSDNGLSKQGKKGLKPSGEALSAPAKSGVSAPPKPHAQ